MGSMHHIHAEWTFLICTGSEWELNGQSESSKDKKKIKPSNENSGAQNM